MTRRFTKEVPEYVYFWSGAGGVYGPYVHPQKGKVNRKFKIEEVFEKGENERSEAEGVREDLPNQQGQGNFIPMSSLW